MKLSSNVERAMRARPAAHVWLSVAGPDEATDFDALARAAGVIPLGDGWEDVDGTVAVRILTALLHRDLSYQREVMPEHRAAGLARRFIAAFPSSGTRFATNRPELPGRSRHGWNPATEYTFDAGVAVIGATGSGLYWVADED